MVFDAKIAQFIGLMEEGVPNIKAQKLYKMTIMGSLNELLQTIYGNQNIKAKKIKYNMS